MRTPRFLPVALVAAVLFSGVCPTAWAQETTVTVQYNGDNDPTNAPNQEQATGPTGGEIPIIIDENVFITDQSSDPVRSGARMVINVQDDPILIPSVEIRNRTDLARQFGFNQPPIPFSSFTLTLTPPASGPGTGVQFLRGGLDVRGFDVIQFIDPFNISLSNRPGSGTLPILPGQSFFVFFRINAPAPGEGEQYTFNLDLRPNVIAQIPEPGTAGLAAAGLLPLLGLIALRRRAA